MLQTAKATFIRNMISMMRAYPWTFFISHILSGIYTVIFGYFTYRYVFQGALNEQFSKYAGTNDYLTYVFLGGAMYAFAVSTLMNVSRSLITEYREGTLEALLLTPSSRKGYFMGNVLQQISRTSLEFIIIILFGMLFGLNLANVDVISSFIIWLGAILAFFTQALVLGSIMLYFRDTYISQNTLFVTMAFVSGVTFPIQYLPEWLQPLSLIMPLTPALEAFRQSVIEGQGLAVSSGQLLHLAILSVIYLLIGSKGIKRTEKIIIEKNFG